jgi:diadenylate cyclase
MELFSFEFIRFTIVDLIDVIVVAFIFYQFLNLMKGTRAAQMIGGLTLLFVVSFFAYWFQLQGLMWLFSNLATVGFIVLVILFQPEIRAALARIGYARLVRVFNRSEEFQWVDEIVDAAARLSELRQGALIVVERNIGLREYSASGTRLDARVSARTISTVFTPYTPLHDGALIIRGNQIVAAGCMLPMSKNPLYLRSYGMRHKAGVGITEETDAVCVIVSEENGQLSVARHGQLKHVADKAELKAALMKSLQE